VPFLGDIPYLGNLFKNSVRNSKRTELLIFLTPKVVSEKAALR
jgi:type IV pilus assembly protein PilQ